MRFEVCSITPVRAELMLQHNFGNRPHVRKSHVDFLSREMLQGAWKVTHEAICIGRNGNVIDGQHRLHAIVQSGCTIETTVCWDFDAESAMHLPINLVAPRNNADIAALGYDVSSILNMFVSLAEGASSKHTLGEFGIAQKFFQSHVERMLTICNSKAAGRSHAATCAAVVLRSIQYGEDVFHQYRAFVLLDYPLMWPSVQALTKRVTNDSEGTRRDRTATAAASWMAFNMARKDVAKLVLRDVPSQLEEIRTYLRSIGFTDELKALRAAAAKRIAELVNAKAATA